MKQFQWILAVVWIACFGIPCRSVDWSWHGSIGATYWLPEWDHELQGFDADTSGLAGPVAFVRYGNIGFGIQYYTGSFDVSFAGFDTGISAHRNDLDLMLSYRLSEIFQVSILYKQIEFDWKQVVKVESSLEGFGVGGGASKAFSNGFLLYGYGFYLPDMDYTQDVEGSGEVDFDSDGLWLEAGAGYLMPQLHLLGKIGYRYQTISAEANGIDWSETTRGPRVEVSYYF